jgi:iron complex outermembrane receptor protein
MRVAVLAGQFAGLFILWVGPFARAEPPPVTPLEPVVAPAPQEAAPVESPVSREPTSDVTTIPIPASSSELKETTDYLQEVPGVVVRDSAGLGQAKQLSIRGASANGVLVLLDGIPLNGAGGIADLSLFPAAALERVEVLRGAGSLFGSGALGGVVNLVTREPQPGLHLFAEGTYGSFGTELGQLSASGNMPGGNGLLLVNALHTNGDFTYLYNPRYPLAVPPLTYTRANNDATLGEALGKYAATWRGWTARLTVEGAAADRGLAGSEEAPASDDRQSMQRIATGLTLSRELDGWGTLLGRAFYRREADRFQGHDYGAFHEVYAIGGGELSASGLVGRHGWTAAVSLSGEAMTDSTGSHPSWASLSALASDEVLFLNGSLSIVPSVRVDQVGPFFGFSPKLGGRLQLPQGFEVRANAGEAFRAPSFLELYVLEGPLRPNPLLEPERTRSGDLQVRHHTDRTDIAVGGFYNRSENLIVYVSSPPANALPINFSAASETGLEVEAQVRPWRLVQASAKYMLLYSEDLRDIPQDYGKELPNHPRHTGWARLSCGTPTLHGQVELVFQSDQFTNPSNLRVPIPGYAFLNLGVGALVPRVRGLSLALEVKNFLDSQTEDLELYPLPRRAFYATLRFTFDKA